MTGVLIAAAIIAVPFGVFVAWPLFRRRGAAVLLPLPPDPREPLLERKDAALRTLRELDFEHEAGHVSDDDYTELRARYETETAAVLSEIDRLGPVTAAPARTAAATAAPVAPGRRSGWRHPVAIGTSAVALVVFGVVLGVGLMRYTEPDPSAGPMPGSRPLASMEAPGGPPADHPPIGGAAAGGAPAGGPAGGPPRPIAPETMRAMLEAARKALEAERYSEAISAYQAVLKRDPQNVDAMTHLALIVAIGGHADAALQTFEKALAIDPNYPPALLYRGQILWDAKKDGPGAIAAWEKFMKVGPPGEDRERVKKLIAEAKAATPPKR